MTLSHAANPIEQEPVQSAYHYLYGRHQLHRYLPGTTRGRYPMETATYADFSGTPTYGPPRRPAQTVEQLVDQGYFAVPNNAPETAILSDRRTTAWLGLDDAIQQIQQRLEIYAQNIYEIKWAECSVINDLFTWEARYGAPAPHQGAVRPHEATAGPLRRVPGRTRLGLARYLASKTNAPRSGPAVPVGIPQTADPRCR